MAGETPQPLVDDKAGVAAEDARVFDALAQAQKQYDEYIKISPPLLREAGPGNQPTLKLAISRLSN